MLKQLVIVGCCLLHAAGHATTDDKVSALYNDWQDSAMFVNQELYKNQLGSLVKQAQQLCQDHVDNPQACALSGIMQTHYATQVNHLQGLKVAKQARDDLQHALSLDPLVYRGEAYAELGTLYHQTPGWPFSFGSQVMAERLLRKAYEVEPDGLISNLRLGEFLFDQQRYPEAQHYLQQAVDVARLEPQLSRLEFQLIQAKQRLAKIQH
ncbi:tetratricopeptide repeat protein [Paraglaciecola hydrolytica]|uniref:Uncharacterized protein n=1 Tax=Paraglaciecola hydrolytica TaxID=1799789 RepID=A0A136A551_9ALTE|nr:hypothetical protein [Paraglaciecola hydrolytica]KXI30336.1 hypothetical protein AX660_10185 [Paraglaciecola hydrolytica]